MIETKAKKIVKTTAKQTVKVTFHFIRWIFAILIIYISIVTVWGYVTSGQTFLQNIITLSIGGFWAFFFGYFGWRLGESIEDYFKFRKKS